MPVFFFTDIEGSTRLWEEHTDEMGAVIAHHDAILQGQVSNSGGWITKHTGDGITAAFEEGEQLAKIEKILQLQRDQQRVGLLAEFTRRAIEACSDLLVASGSCNAYSGVGRSAQAGFKSDGPGTRRLLAAYCAEFGAVDFLQPSAARL